MTAKPQTIGGDKLTAEALSLMQESRIQVSILRFLQAGCCRSMVRVLDLLRLVCLAFWEAVMVILGTLIKFLLAATVLWATVLGSAALAQTAVIDEVIVTTTRADSLRIDNAGNIATIDPSEAVNLFPVEMLNRAPGVHIHRGGGKNI